ncbi:MAG: DinB family protein [Bacteroidota bacterium]
MLPPLQRRYDALERRRRSALATLRPLAPAARQRRPAPETWSLNEVVHHLVLVDEGMARSIRCYLDQPPRQPAASAPFKVLAMRAFFALPTRVRIPAQVAAITPRDTPDFETLAADWSAARAGLGSMLEAVPAERLKAVAFKHPLGGRMSLVDAVAFIGWHQDHHRKQLRRTLAAVTKRAVSVE